MPRVDVGGCALCFGERGRGEAVVMLHGIGARGDDWRAHAEALAPSYRVITPDLRGHGDSDKPRGPYSIAQMARDVLRLLDALGIDAAHVVGVSLGGMFGLELAVSAPARVRSLT